MNSRSPTIIGNIKLYKKISLNVLKIRISFYSLIRIQIRPGTSEFFNPTGRYGIISLNENEQIELYCSSGFSSPGGAGNTVIATCASGNQFLYNNARYYFNQFYCTNFPAHTARKSGARCYNNGYIVQHGFVVGSRFLNVFDSCFDEIREEALYSHYQLKPENDGFQSGLNFFTTYVIIHLSTFT